MHFIWRLVQLKMSYLSLSKVMRLLSTHLLEFHRLKDGECEERVYSRVLRLSLPSLMMIDWVEIRTCKGDITNCQCIKNRARDTCYRRQKKKKKKKRKKNILMERKVDMYWITSLESTILSLNSDSVMDQMCELKQLI